MRLDYVVDGSIGCSLNILGWNNLVKLHHHLISVMLTMRPLLLWMKASWLVIRSPATS